jgi:hypothetical protein
MTARRHQFCPRFLIELCGRTVVIAAHSKRCEWDSVPLAMLLADLNADGF